jgi:hypothetical protein
MFNELRIWNYHFKSVVLDGFVDNNDMVQIHNNITEDEEDMESTISVSDYLKNLVNPANNEVMFEFVYPAINGKREFIMTVNQLGEVNNFLH